MASRRAILVPLVSLLAILIGVAFADDTKVARHALHRALAVAVDDVAEMANLQPDGEPDGPPPVALPVEVVVQGDVPWLQGEAEAVVADHAAFKTTDGPHELRFEYVQDGRTWALRAQLWRRGWSLRPPQPVNVRIFPWVAVLAAALGGVLWARGVPLLIASLVAGGGAQLGLAAMPWPEGLLRPELVDAVAQGTLGRTVVHWARSLPDISVAVGAGIVALCLVLVIFDHRRSRGRGGAALVTTVVAVVSAAAWIEAAARAEVLSWAATPAGAFGAVGLLGLWGTRAWALRRAFAEPAAADDAKGDDAKGDDAKGDDAKGDDAKGDGAKSDDGTGDETKADDAKADDAKADDAKGDETKSDEAEGDGSDANTVDRDAPEGT